jgi:energy-coupling factor transport system ATP-binding protein
VRKVGRLLPYIVDVEDLWFRYRGSSDWVLKGVNLKVAPGEFIVIMGPSGCGKSTLALALTGAASRLLFGEGKGKVVVDGIDALEAPSYEISQHVAMVLQNPETQLVAMTVREELAFGPENLQLPPSEIRHRIEEVGAKMRLAPLLDRRVNALSGGEKQAVAVASILTLRPRVVILDEITSMLDPVGMGMITGLIERMHQEHKLTILAIDHRVEWASEIADRIVIMNEGRIDLDAPPHEAFKDREYVRKIGFRAPQVTEVAYRMMDKARPIASIPVTLNEATETFSTLLRTRKHATD